MSSQLPTPGGRSDPSSSSSHTPWEGFARDLTFSGPLTKAQHPDALFAISNLSSDPF